MKAVRTPVLAGLLVLILVQSAAADRIPLRDGLYAADPSYCGLNASQRLDRFGDEIALHMRRITGNEVDYLYESACWIRYAGLKGNRLSMTRICNAEGETWEQDIAWTILSDESFIDLGTQFNRCQSTSPTSSNQ